MKPKEAIIPEPNVNERVRSGEATLEEVPVLAKAHQVVAEKQRIDSVFVISVLKADCACAPIPPPLIT